jgi:hypothetical protein
MTQTNGLTTIARGSDLPGVSPFGRVVIARLENTRLQPGQVREAIEHWERFVRDPAHRLYDSQYTGCGMWGCCPAMDDVQQILHIVVRSLPRRDSRRLQIHLDRLDDCWRQHPPYG